MLFSLKLACCAPSAWRMDHIARNAADPPVWPRLRLVVAEPRAKLTDEPPLTSVQPLWRLVKDGHIAEAGVRPIDGIGVELRYEWDADLAVFDRVASG